MKKPLVLMILDGFGINNSTVGNAIYSAKTPNIDALMAKYPHTEIQASGMDVGLPRGQMGNSEVGHTNIGAGRIVYQELTRITKTVEEGGLSAIPELQKAVANCKEHDSSLHLMGLLSDGGVHSHIQHLFGLLAMAKEQGLEKVYVHCFMDGRDVPPSSGKDYVEQLQAELNRLGVGKIATICGRYYAMDRDNRWERVSKAYDAMVNGIGVEESDPVKAMADSYANGVTDEFVVPVVVDKNGSISANDSVIFFNFRPDRAREITRTLVDEAFNGFERAKGFFPLCYTCMTQYDATMPNVQVAFHPQSLEDTFGEYISNKGLKQLRIAETEKYAHVTFFFNGGVETVYPGEDRCLINSPKVATYDLQPEMSAYEVTDALEERLGNYDVIIINYANCDMVGHTGVFEAAVKAVEAVDTCVGRIVNKTLELGGAVLLTADHGNADQMLAEDNTPFTAHTTNPVPLLAVGLGDIKLREGGRLADLAPTMLSVLGLEKPEAMSGESLILA
ncbi:MAG: 2,3-bisphosphoglycerate-independent phosphoglycerate mutase [Oscillospiraceae bacterium]|nr:2,3-bisphosphoglycerate-independent phosphoglycerate mutase [Oscillospiraceae bacterium]